MYKEMLLTNNRPGRKLTPKGIVLHDTANMGVGAYNHYLYFNKPETGASAHAVIDWKDIIQLIPFNEVAWHAGRTANNNYIGVEMCRATTQEQFDIVYKNTVDFFADILVENLGITEVTTDNIMSHAEVSLKWKETDHTDPKAYFKQFDKSIDIFRFDVQQAINKKMNGGTEMSKITVIGEGKDIKVLVDGNEIDSSGLIECKGVTVCLNFADTLRAIGHDVSWQAE